AGARARHLGQSVPLPGLRQDSHGDDARRRTDAEGLAMAKLIGQNYTTPDIVAKVTGKAKYSEDHRAEGMLFAKLLLSPMPDARGGAPAGAAAGAAAPAAPAAPAAGTPPAAGAAPAGAAPAARGGEARGAAPEAGAARGGAAAGAAAGAQAPAGAGREGRGTE